MAMALLRPAIDMKQKVKFDYIRADGEHSSRTVWPLGLFFWDTGWTLGAWCEYRQAFRSFRLDRMRNYLVTDEYYQAVAGKMLSDFVKAARAMEF